MKQLGAKDRLFFENMSGKGNTSAPKLDLKLNLSPPSVNSQRVESPEAAAISSSSSSSEISPRTSCVSWEADHQVMKNYESSPETSSMLLVGCPRCLMYVMLSDVDPKCPKCKSTVLLDVLCDEPPRKQ